MYADTKIASFGLIRPAHGGIAELGLPVPLFTMRGMSSIFLTYR